MSAADTRPISIWVEANKVRICNVENTQLTAEQVESLARDLRTVARRIRKGQRLNEWIQWLDEHPEATPDQMVAAAEGLKTAR